MYFFCSENKVMHLADILKYEHDATANNNHITDFSIKDKCSCKDFWIQWQYFLGTATLTKHHLILDIP